MALLTRANYIPNTLIASAPVNTDFNQLVDLLSGVSTTKDALIKFNHATDPVLRVDQLGAGLIQKWLNNGVDRVTLASSGKLLFPVGVGSTPTTVTMPPGGLYAFNDSFSAIGSGTVDSLVKAVDANVLGASGDAIEIWVMGRNINAGNKQIILRVNSVDGVDSGTFTAAGRFAIHALMMRSGSGLSTTAQLHISGGVGFFLGESFEGAPSFGGTLNIHVRTVLATGGDVIIDRARVMKWSVS